MITIKPIKFIGATLAYCLLALLILFIIFNFFFIECRQVMSGSMANTLLHGDYIISWRLNFTGRTSQANLQQLHYKDIVFFDLPGKHESLIKRIIGLPGDTVVLSPAGIYINGKYLHETYIQQAKAYTKTQIFQLAKDQLFVLGDNRPISEDSEEFGPVPLAAIKGKVVLIYYPLSRCRWLL